MSDPFIEYDDCECEDCIEARRVEPKFRVWVRKAKRWINDLFHPGRQQTYRDMIANKNSRNSYLNEEVHRLEVELKKADDFIKDKSLSVADVITASAKIMAPSVTIPDYGSVYDYDYAGRDISPEYDNTSASFKLYPVHVRVRLPDCGDLHKWKLRDDKQKWLFCNAIAQRIAGGIVNPLMKEMFGGK